KAVAERNRFLLFLLVAAILTGAVGVRGLVGGELATLAMWYGNVMWSALLLLAVCGYVLFQRSSVFGDPTRTVYRLGSAVGGRLSNIVETPPASLIHLQDLVRRDRVPTANGSRSSGA